MGLILTHLTTGKLCVSYSPFLALLCLVMERFLFGAVLKQNGMFLLTVTVCMCIVIHCTSVIHNMCKCGSGQCCLLGFGGMNYLVDWQLHCSLSSVHHLMTFNEKNMLEVVKNSYTSSIYIYNSLFFPFWYILGKAIDMSVDHKPTDKAELYRIMNAGGHVGADERVNGGLNLSRAIGKF